MPEVSEKSIFLQALEWDTPRERAAFVVEACGGDTELRSQVEALLRAHEQEDHLLDSPPSLFAHREQIDPTLLAGKGVVIEPTETEGPGTTIGRYELLEQIGEGGFGRVFVARQTVPVSRRVALKVIKPGMDSREVIARFEAERQALAMMDHPNIARVFDAGTTSSGRPYFVMELVRGIPITEFCDDYKLDMRQRLELFVNVCRAVQHAHQKGVIHRDIKPSNVLVTLHDAKPVPKVIDFGVAKAMGQSLTEKTVYSRFAAMIGTPLYMSPEQAEMTGQDVDTRSDIFSLGVLLYELLTGITPFDRKRLNEAGFDELRRILRDEEPPRPSARLTTLGQALSTVSQKRRTEPARLLMLVRQDLDWIVMKAIEKDRNRRYETANALASDVARYLNAEPINARPPSRMYRFRKFAERNRAAILSISLIVAAMIFGMGVSLWQAAVAVSERNDKVQALAEAVQARDEANAARRQVEEFTQRLQQVNVLMIRGRSNADADRWSDAAHDYAQATELLPTYDLIWIERSAFFTRMGLWDLASDDAVRALELGIAVDGPVARGAPQLLWMTDRKTAYDAMCRKIVTTAETSPDGLTLVNMVGLLVDPQPMVDPAMLAERAEELLSKVSRREGERHPPRRGPPQDLPREPPPPPNEPFRRGPPGFDPGPPPPRPQRPPQSGRPFDLEHGPVRLWAGGQPWGANLYITGWAHYRAGHWLRALERLEAANADDPGWPGHGIPFPLIAMAHHQLGEANEAREALTAADDHYDRWVSQIARSPTASPPIPWFDWIEFVVLRREAYQLIHGRLPNEDPRLLAAQQRALALLGRDPAADGK